MPKITIQMPDGQELKFGLDLEKITVGRADGNDIVIDDASVSSGHAEFALQKGGNFRLTDLDSTNGTRVNGSQIAEAFLEDGDSVRFGNIESAYESDVPKGEKVELPQEQREEPAVGASSVRPNTFANDQPFQKKKKTTDPMGTLLIALAVFAIIACILAAFFTTMMSGAA